MPATAASRSTITALVTGASSGIGAALAALMAADGINLVITARRGPETEAMAADWRQRHGVDVSVIPLDLARPGAARELVVEIDQRGLAIDYLVNNAGFGTYGHFAVTSVTETEELLRLNVESLTILTRLLLPGIIARRGKIMNVASTAAFQPGPHMAVYYASKAYVLHFSEALAYELGDSGVSVTSFCPGATKSGFQQRARMQKAAMLNMVKMPSSEEVARAAWQAMRAGQGVVVPGLLNWLLSRSVRFAPRRLVTWGSALVTGPGGK
ncbi:MAG: SDR family oxidoreductase [Burkholderiaceae bacterium]|nr:SDR family oxidoreductase [Burkholderiaceae bacterium]